MSTWWSFHKIPKVWVSESFWVEHIYPGRMRQPNSRETEAPLLWTLPDFTLYIFSSGCLSCTFCHIFNKLVKVRKFPWVLWTAVAKLTGPKGQGLWKSPIYSGLVRSPGDNRACNWCLKLCGGAVLWDWALNLWIHSMQSQGRLCQNWVQL